MYCYTGGMARNVEMSATNDGWNHLEKTFLKIEDRLDSDQLLMVSIPDKSESN